MKLLLENWREYLDEMVSVKGRGLAHHGSFKGLIERDENIPKMVGYHASKAVFDQFDNSRLGSNTDMGKAGEDKYNLDSYLGHMFVPNAQQLTPHMKKLRSRYIYSVTLTPGKVAVLDIRRFKDWFSADVGHSRQNLKEFGKWLKDKGYGGLRYTDSKSDITLLSDTIQVFDAGNTNIRSIWDTETDKRFRAKDLQGQSFADAFGVKE
jgi:hypothetical protein